MGRGPQAAADAGTAKYDKAIDRIDARAEERGAREVAAMRIQLEDATQAVAVAKTALRVAARDDRPAAKATLKRAEDTLRRVEKAARRLGL